MALAGVCDNLSRPVKSGIYGRSFVARRGKAAYMDVLQEVEMRFSPTFLDDIRDRVPISNVIARRVSWDKRKTNVSRGDYWACCPFHDEAITYGIGDLEELELPEASFDFAHSSLAFHYVRNFERLVTTVYRALVPGSRFVFTIEHPIFMLAICEESMAYGWSELRFFQCLRKSPCLLSVTY